MPVAISFCGYSLYIYIKRAAMIRRKDPGPCKFTVLLSRYSNCEMSHVTSFPLIVDEDTVGPTVLASMLGLAILVNFGVKIYDYHT
jgi:hypothetical protein